VGRFLRLLYKKSKKKKKKEKKYLIDMNSHENLPMVVVLSIKMINVLKHVGLQVTSVSAYNGHDGYIVFH
jgi:hypothetical protein